MTLHNRLSNITQNTTKTIRNATIWIALISALQSCENATWASWENTKIETINTINNEDADIVQFEATLPYAQQWNEPIPSINEQDSIRVENQFARNTLRSIAQDKKPTMDTVDHIVLHSTEHQPWKEEETINFLKIAWKMHFIVKRNGEIIQYLPSQSDRLVQVNHIGKWDDESSNAMWNHDHFVTFKSIWIEVSALPTQKRSDAQYEALQKLLWYLGKKYNLIQKDIITHTMVAYSKQYGLMRKQDPFGIQWNRLWLAPGSAQINKDIVSWDIAPNLTSMYERLRKPRVGKNPWWAMTHEEAIAYLQYHYSWVDNAIALHKRRFWCINPTAQFWEIEKVWWMIADINENMRLYKPKYVYTKKRVSHKTRHRR